MRNVILGDKTPYFTVNLNFRVKFVLFVFKFEINRSNYKLSSKQHSIDLEVI